MRTRTPAVEAGLAGLLLLLAATGCARNPAAGDAGPAAAVDERLRNAIGSYVEGYNLLGESVNALLARYTAAVPVGGTAPGVVRLEPAHLEVAERLKRARAEFDVGMQDGGAALAELGPLADRLRATARKVMKTYAEAEHYYASGGFKDDAGAGAATYHEEMRVRAADFRQALSDLAEALDRVEDRQAQAEIAALAAGRGAGYWFRRANQTAKRMMGAVRALPELRGFNAEREALQALAGELGGLAASHEGGLPGAFGEYRKALDELLASAGRLARAVVPAAGPVPSPDVWAMFKQGLFDDYNALIQAGNALYDLEEQDQLE